MKTLTRISLFLVLGFNVLALSAQNANSTLKTLYTHYSNIPDYKVSVHYVAENEMMGFKNEQNGELIVEGDKYILTFGPNETWLGDGKSEYIGTKEEDHSELIIFCKGENFEVPLNYGSLFTFYGSGVDSSMEGELIKVVPKDESFKYAFIKASGNTLQEIVVVDEMDMAHRYTFSSFSTNPTGTAFTINPKEYADTIDERQGCN